MSFCRSKFEMTVLRYLLLVQVVVLVDVNGKATRVELLSV